MSEAPQPQVYLTTPTFGFIPDALPRTVPPPVNEHTFRAPFGIDPWLFNFALKPEIPIIFASTYVVTVFFLNTYNRRRNNQPWWISRQPAFQWFVIVHNAVLTLYSATTFLAMCRAIAHTWPGWNPADGGYARMADALCKMHGPRGIGDAATYNTTLNIWEVKNTIIKLGYRGNPDPTDVGRLWNEGLAFWGWVFYVSKFYEVVDTLIILAKGKRSATLQTYHHSGAMLCMWAGIRFMSPPIWMFVFVNSFIHALMYTYFTLSALGVKVPQSLKRSLTSLQIAQFVWGASYAAAHLFIQYDIPISTPYQIARTVKAAASSVSSAFSAASSTASKVIESPAASGTLAAVVKKLLLRAAGEEGMAERITNDWGDSIAPGMAEKIESVIERTEQIFETRYHNDLSKINCIDTSGEAFAIYLNLLYLFPLTFLFGRFFVKAYTSRGKPRSTSEAAKQAVNSGKEAAQNTKETVEKTSEQAEDELQRKAELAREQLRKDVKAMKDGTWGRERRVSDHVSNLERQAKSAAETVKEQGKKIVNGAQNPQVLSPAKESKDTPQVTPQEKPIVKDESAIEDEPEKAREAEQTSPPAKESQSKKSKKKSKSKAAKSSAAEQDNDKENQTPPPDSSKDSPKPADSKDEEEEDTDAMGKSGAIVDFAAEKAQEAKVEAEEVKQKTVEAGEVSEDKPTAVFGP